MLLAWLLAAPALAHDGDDHSKEAPAPTANSPQRAADGSVLLPKASQRQLAIRTVLTAQRAWPQTRELSGKVVVDPNAGGKVQAAFAGRIEPGPRGFPALGQAVRKGEVLAYIRPAFDAIARANQLAQAAELRAGRTLAQQRLARLRQLEGSVPQKDIDAARLELASLGERLAAVGASVNAREALSAPAAGLVAAANVVAGQVVDARDVVFEIVDPARLRVEALAYDSRLAADIAGASASPAPGQSFALELLGAGAMLREQAIPIQFRLKPGQGRGGQVALAVGQPLKVLVQTRSKVTGVAVPAEAIVKNGANQDIVWVHEQAERFVPKTVRTAPLDGANVLVQDGVAAGERVVVRGASLLSQVR
ncbi:efflux RND transporter periplasmic adaptor subunit [Massilia glaciei]|nr:HlyD family efflux transporter periplasmic adaptor subunit [Massilia glaciei]